jgi:ubiquinol-cytochrome c reductase iron-sulfur subunit
VFVFPGVPHDDCEHLCRSGSRSHEHDAERRRLLLLTSAAGAVAAGGVALPLVASFSPSERALAMGAAVEADISDIAAGAIKTIEWRGKPVWVMRRTPEMLASLPLLDSQLVDPASEVKSQQPDYAQNAHRSIKPEYMVTVGICTHLGCSPTSVPAGTSNPSVGADWKGGFFALAMALPLIWQAVCSKTSPPRPT